MREIEGEEKRGKELKMEKKKVEVTAFLSTVFRSDISPALSHCVHYEQSLSAA